MLSVATLWIPFTIVAALGQVARNAMQRSLTGPLGTWGATNIRFLFGFPFALVFLAAVLAVTGLPLPAPPPVYAAWIALGTGAQIVATATMLMAMNGRSFVVTIAYIKTEAIQAAVFGLGATLDVLFEKSAKRPGQIVGKSPYLQSVHAMAPATMIGEIHPVMIDTIGSFTLSGTLAAIPARADEPMLSALGA